MVSGNPKTREFYDHVGWQRDPNTDQLIDTNLFGVKEDGPIRIELFNRHLDRIRARLRKLGENLNILECGCGGNPEVKLLRSGDRYTGVDFSSAGLVEAEKSLQGWGGTYHLHQEDLCDLSFADGTFDAIYSAHVLYHIDNPEAQAKALKHFARVLRPGGVAVLLLANPYPLLFPVRMMMRLAVTTPGLGSFVRRIRKPGPLPYRPMSIGWYVSQLRPFGKVEVVTGVIPSVWFSQRVTEFRYPGRLLWQAINALDASAPHLSAKLGNYFLLFLEKS